MGLGRLLEALQRREEREAIREVWRVTALARAISGGVSGEELLADLLGPERAREIVQAPVIAKWKARQRPAAYEG